MNYDGPVVVSPDNKFIAIEKQTDNIELWNVETGERDRSIPIKYPHYWTFSPDSKTLLVTSWWLGDKVHLFDVRTGDEIFTGTFKKCYEASFTSTEDEILGWNEWSDSVILWNLYSPDPIRIFSSHGPTIIKAQMSHDGRWIFTMNYDNTVSIWNRQDNFLHGVYHGSANCFLLSPNERYLLLPDGNSLKAIDLATSKEIGAIVTMPGDISTMNFSKEGNILLVGGGGVIAIFDVPKEFTVKRSGSLKIPKKIVRVGAFVPNSARPAFDNGKPFNPQRTDGKFEVLDANHNTIAVLFEGSRHTGKWHVFDWDATDKPKGTYYKRITIGGEVTEEKFELK
jgi:WD40 repeat protein